MLLLAAFAAAVSVAAQTCQPNILVDDFRPRNSSLYREQPLVVNGEAVSLNFHLIPLPDDQSSTYSSGCLFSPNKTGCDAQTGFNGCNKTLNFLGGDYGDSGAAEVLTNGQLQITSSNNSAVTSNLETPSHPLTAETINYWFVKFDWENDFDLTPFSGLSLDLIAPVGSDFNITLTQWIPSNNTRGVDSQYRLLSSYLTPTGKPQTLNLKWSDFSTNLYGQPYDFKNLKDLTLVNFVPVASQFVFTRIELIGNCSASATATTASGGGSGLNGAASSVTAAANGASSAKSLGVRVLSNVGVLAGVVAAWFVL
ncbi:hypothetical protein HDU98_001620 [Podochytrium sp. JEL0797]|nr:hypothetical protein HDU98_001620 [Podochytrium sp. JEL0797]